MKWYLNLEGEKIIGAYGANLFEGLVEIENEENFDRTHFKYSNGGLVQLSDQERRILYPYEVSVEENQKLDQMMMSSMRISFLNELPDEQAKDIPYCYIPWSDYADGYEFTENKERVEHNGGLWKCKKTHKKQASWYPGADPTLWEQLDKENHEGTLEDPIPVPESVTTSGFTYIYGKYYSEADQKYLFKRGGIPDEQAEAMYGQTETLYFPPSAVVGTYTVRIG